MFNEALVLTISDVCLWIWVKENEGDDTMSMFYIALMIDVQEAYDQQRKLNRFNATLTGKPSC